MRREAITLVMAMGIGTVLMAACDTPEQQAATPEAALGALTKEPTRPKDFEQKKGRQHWEHVPIPEDLARGPEAVQAAIPLLSLT